MVVNREGWPTVRAPPGSAGDTVIGVVIDLLLSVLLCCVFYRALWG
jgi:hypothetical protein